MTCPGQEPLLAHRRGLRFATFYTKLRRRLLRPLSPPDRRHHQHSEKRCAPPTRLRMFCSYVSDPDYGWDRVCEQRFGSHPRSGVLRMEHRHACPRQWAVPGEAGIHKRELQDFLDHADDQVALIAASGRAWCAAKTPRY